MSASPVPPLPRTDKDLYVSDPRTALMLPIPSTLRQETP